MTSLATLSADTIDAHATAIAAGARPAALLMTWVEQKEIGGEFPERFLINVILDGHHKLAAYSRLGQPARVLALCRVEDSWGPPEDPARWLRDAFATLHAATPGHGST